MKDLRVRVMSTTWIGFEVTKNPKVSWQNAMSDEHQYSIHFHVWTLADSRVCSDIAAQ